MRPYLLLDHHVQKQFLKRDTQTATSALQPMIFSNFYASRRRERGLKYDDDLLSTINAGVYLLQNFKPGMFLGVLPKDVLKGGVGRKSISYKRPPCLLFLHPLSSLSVWYDFGLQIRYRTCCLASLQHSKKDDSNGADEGLFAAAAEAEVGMTTSIYLDQIWVHTPFTSPLSPCFLSRVNPYLSHACTLQTPTNAGTRIYLTDTQNRCMDDRSQITICTSSLFLQPICRKVPPRPNSPCCSRGSSTARDGDFISNHPRHTQTHRRLRPPSRQPNTSIAGARFPPRAPRECSMQHPP